MNISEFEKEIEKSYAPQYPNREFKISLQKSFRTNEYENKLNILFPFQIQKCSFFLQYAS